MKRSTSKEFSLLGKRKKLKKGKRNFFFFGSKALVTRLNTLEEVKKVIKVSIYMKEY
jgi:hypothetical protein